MIMSTNYLYNYADGTTGDSQYRRTMGADGNWSFDTGADGKMVEGTYGGVAPGQGAYNPLSGTTAATAGMSNSGSAGTSSPSMPSANMGFGGSPQIGSGGPQYGGGSSGANPYGSMGASTGYSPNPYLKQQADSIQAMSNQNLAQNVMPGIRSGALANGQYGSSRQGIAEGVAAGNAQTGVNSAVANLYGGAYNTDQSAMTQRTANNQSYNLGMGNLGLGYTNAQNNYNLGQTQQNQNFYSTQRGQDLTQYGLGAQLYGQGVTGQLGVGTGQYGVGQTYMNAPLTSLQQYSNTITPYSGLNSAQQVTGSYNGGATGALGGALGGMQIAKNLGFSSGSGSSSNPAAYQTGSVLSNSTPYGGYTGDYNNLSYVP